MSKKRSRKNEKKSPSIQNVDALHVFLGLPIEEKKQGQPKTNIKKK